MELFKKNALFMLKYIPVQLILMGINMQNMILVSDIVEENGKTVKQNNLEMVHDISLGSLVEIVEDEYSEDGGVRMFVVDYSRDCDGTPLYDLSHDKNAAQKLKQFEADCEAGEFETEPYGFALKMVSKGRYMGLIAANYGREGLKVIKEA